MTRLLFAGLTLVTLVAFAPAPFPRAHRASQRDGLSLEELRGDWTVTSLQTTRSNGAHVNSGTQLARVRIAGDRWSFVYGQNFRNDVEYNIRVDHRLRPPTLDFYSLGTKEGNPYGMGILQRDGDTVRLMYNWGGSRATSFESPPEGHWLITLRRAR